ncbi:MAG: MerR family transcriptional regulator [Chloroflexi bacterium]|nr:MerR family transcriptional regulator [Chloroflexota bacterium]
MAEEKVELKELSERLGVPEKTLRQWLVKHQTAAGMWFRPYDSDECKWRWIYAKDVGGLEHICGLYASGMTQLDVTRQLLIEFKAREKARRVRVAEFHAALASEAARVDLLQVSEVSRLLGVEAATLNRWMKRYGAFICPVIARDGRATLSERAVDVLRHIRDLPDPENVSAVFEDLTEAGYHTRPGTDQLEAFLDVVLPAERKHWNPFRKR